ncbi:MAG: hypothetical protein AAGF12_09980 [Myxococcota bacterium]
MKSQESGPAWVGRIERFLEARTTRLCLVVLIILSVVPFPGIEHALREVFIVVFGIELTLRVSLMVQDTRHRTLFDYFFIAVDVAAFASFLPIQDALGDVAIPLRLARLLVLLRFARDLAADVYYVLTRREQLQQFGLVTVSVIAMAFSSAVILTVLEIPHRYDESQNGTESFWDRMWWSFRQIESPDNLVSSLTVHPFVAIASLTLTVMGVFVVSFIIGLGATVVGKVIQAERRRPVRYRNHTVILGGVESAELLVQEFVRIYDKNRAIRRFRSAEIYEWLFHEGPKPRRSALPQMALLGGSEEPPPYLLEPAMRWVVYRMGEGASPADLRLVGAHAAKRAIVLAPSDAGLDADAVTVATLANLRDQNPHIHAFVEVSESADEPLVRSVGGAGTFPLDVPGFLGLFLLHHLVLPGVEELLSTLLTAEGSEFYTHIYVDRRELQKLEALSATEPTLAFDRLAELGRREGVLVTGVLLGEGDFGRTGRELIPVDELYQWVNPTRLSPEARRFGARAGSIPTAHLRGIIGVAATYLPVRRFARRLIHRGTGTASEPRLPNLPTEAFRATRPKVGRVLLVGYSPALRGLLHGLAELVPGVDVVLAISARDDALSSIPQRLRRIGFDFDTLPGAEGQTEPLPRGGKARIFTHEGADLTGFAVRSLDGPVDVAVFLSDPESKDRDARTFLRVIRFAHALESGAMPRGHRLHLMAEFASPERGHTLKADLQRHRCGYDGSSDFEVTLISTDRLKNYFMVHSAFVPGVTELYDRILHPEGQTLVRIGVDPMLVGGPVRFEELSRTMLNERCILLAVELADGSLEVHPPPSRIYQAEDLTGLFAVGHRDLLMDQNPPGDSKHALVAATESSESADATLKT